MFCSYGVRGSLPSTCPICTHDFIKITKLLLLF